ncbi:hypothetical protein STEG23_027104 [Scotinomys teguina]
MEHEKEMSDMNKFLEETSEALHKCKEPNENTKCYRVKVHDIHHSRVLRASCVFLPRNMGRGCREHQVLEDNIQLLQKQKALLIQQRDLAVKQQHPFTVSQMRNPRKGCPPIERMIRVTR